MQAPITIPFDRSLRPQTTYLVFDNLNNYGPIDIRVADNYTGNQPSQVCYVPAPFAAVLHNSSCNACRRDLKILVYYSCILCSCQSDKFLHTLCSCHSARLLHHQSLQSARSDCNALLMQIHLSLAGPNSYWVMWATGQSKVSLGSAPSLSITSTHQTLLCTLHLPSFKSVMPIFNA